MSRPDWRALSEALWERSGQACERCGALLADPDRAERHHRRLRSGGGAHTLDNLVQLCPRCHHARVHACPKNARADGWMVSRYQDPATVPVYLARYGWALLRADGTIAPPEAA